MKDKFEMNKLGLLSYLLGMESNSIWARLFPMSKKVYYEVTK
jgi:hypothetical protein